MNRGVMVTRGSPNEEELILSARLSCIYLSFVLISTVYDRTMQYSFAYFDYQDN